jgi:uncharacterized membrane protein (DUF4010 family)
MVGGLVSSTVVTIPLSRRASADRVGYERLTAAIVVASATTFLRIPAILAPVSFELCRLAIAPVAASATVALGAAALFVLRARGRDAKDSANRLAVENPLELASALEFGLVCPCFSSSRARWWRRLVTVASISAPLRPGSPTSMPSRSRSRR